MQCRWAGLDRGHASRPVSDRAPIPKKSSGSVSKARSADRALLALENAVLRQQLNVLKRSVKRARINDGDRFANWKEHLVVVKPETVVRWHRQGFRYYWKRKSQPKGGRPAIAPEVIRLIRLMPRAARIRFVLQRVAMSHGAGG